MSGGAEQPGPAEPAGERPVPAEHHIEVPRSARYYTLGTPVAAREVWFVLHGYSQLARRFLRSFRPIARPHRLLVAPEALNRYYAEYAPGYHRPDARVCATWMTREDRLHEIADYVRYLDRLAAHLTAPAPSAPPRRVLLGFSQGAATAARWAALGETRFARVILWGGLLPDDLPRGPDLVRGASLTFVFGRSDAYAPAARVEAAVAGLRAAGVAHRLRWFDGGHELAADALAALAAES